MDLFELSATLGLDTSGFSSGITGAMNMITGLTDFAEKKFAWLGNAALDFGKDVLDTGLGFDKAMGSVQAVLGREEGTVENMNKLRQFAMDQARKSIFTTEDAANAYYYMGQMGWKTEQMMAGLPAVLDLAAASGLGLEQTSRIVSSSLSAFGKDAEDAEWYVDILAQTSRNSGTDVSEMAEAFKFAAPYAGALGVGVDDTALALGLMGDNAIRSGMAGRTLRNVFSRLANDTNDALTTLQGLGVEVFDDTGKFRDFSDIIMDSREVWAGMTDQQKIANATIVAGQQGSSGWLSIMNATDDKVKDLTESIKGATGAAHEMAETRLDNLSGDINYFNSELNVLKTSLYDNVKDPMREVVQEGTAGLGRITDAIQEGGIIGGLKQLTIELQNLKENETFKEFLKSAGEAGGEIVSILTTDVLPGLDNTVVGWGHKLAEGAMGGISDYLTEHGKGGSGIFSLLANWFGTDMSKGTGSMTGTNDVFKVPAEVVITSDVQRIQELIDDAVSKGKTTVTVDGIEFSTDYSAETIADALGYAGDQGGKKMADNVESKISDAAPGIGNILSFFVGDAGDSAGSTFSTLFGNVLDADAPGMSDDLGNALGDAGSDAGSDIVSDIQSALNFAKFTVSVIGVVSSIVNTVKSVFSHNASAMSSGRIYTKPTVFGYYDNAYQVAGDAGPEAVVGVNSLQRMITSAVHGAGGQEIVVPRNESRNLTVILELDRQQMGKAVYKLNNEETQRVGVRLANGGAY